MIELRVPFVNLNSAMIDLKDIYLSYGGRKIFSGASASILRRDRIGLVGSNGAGKTTLLKVLKGIEALDSGEISKPAAACVGYLPQEGIVHSQKKLYAEVESAFGDIIDLRNQAREFERVLKESSADSQEYLSAIDMLGEIQHKLEFAEESKLRSKIESVLLGLGFSMRDMERSCGEFSGGWQMRIALAKLLLQEPSLLMLDEPTNHLDIESVAWLEDYLQSYGGAIILVSHDRTFLNAVSNKIWRIKDGILDFFTGDYDDFVREAQHREISIERAAENQKKRLEKTERFIERFRSKASKAAQVQSRIKALEKVEIIETKKGDSKINFHFPNVRRCARVVAEIKEIEKSYGANKVLDKISFNIERGDRIALVGVNGAGKSTLSKIIAGVVPSDAGEIKFGEGVEMSYFAQHQAEELNPSNDVLSEAGEAAPMSRKMQVRGLLGSFLFRGDDVFKPVRVLSGGEKNRLALAKMLLKDFNFLLLDEPTNHLDMDSKKVLQSALNAFEGTFMIVSHDRDFLDPIVDRVIELSVRGMRSFPGNVSDYLERIKGEGRLNLRPVSSQGGKSAWKEERAKKQAARAELGALKREASSTEKNIESLEAEINKTEELMASPDFFKNESLCAEICTDYDRMKLELEKLYANWENIHEKISELEN